MAETTSKKIPETVEEALRLWDAGEPVTTVSMGGLGEPYEQCIQNLAFELMREWHLLPWPSSGDDVSDELRNTLRESSDRISAELDKTHRFSGAQVGAANNIAAVVCRQGYREALSHPEVADRLITVTKKAPEWPATTPHERRCVMPTDLPMPTRGDAVIVSNIDSDGNHYPSMYEAWTYVEVGGTCVCALWAERGTQKANAALIAAAFNSATAAADLGFDPIAAVEALPELLKAIEAAGVVVGDLTQWSCQNPDNGSEMFVIQQQLVTALTAARTRKEASDE